MPFTPTPELNQSSDVKIFFSGLLILKPIENNLCEVFVHTSAPRHFLTIEVRRKHNDNQPDEVMMRHIGPLAFIATPDRDGPDGIPVHGMEIRKVFGQGAGQSAGVQKFAPDNPQPNDLPAGFNLAINLEGAGFHQGNPELASVNPEEPTRRLLDIDPLGARPSILLRDGVLYTAAKTRPNIVINLQKQNGEAIRELPPFASLIGAAIPLEANTHVALRWRQQGKVETLNLNKEDNVKYEIYIVNDPLFENDSIQNVEKDPKHDEFREYYKILPRVPSDQQFRLDVEIPQTVTSSRGSTRAPCMSISLDGSD